MSDKATQDRAATIRRVIATAHGKCGWGCDEPDETDFEIADGIIEALHAAGYRILGQHEFQIPAIQEGFRVDV